MTRVLVINITKSIHDVLYIPFDLKSSILGYTLDNTEVKKIISYTLKASTLTITF